MAALTNAFAIAAPSMSLAVLFEEIAADLNLSLVQVGMVWGIASLPSILFSLVGGAIGDRFGPKRVLIIGCLAAGLFGALRGLTVNFATLIAAMLLFGTAAPFISMNTVKTCGMWFPKRQLGLASGVLSMAMAFGFLFGSMFSATTLSPMLGGWRNVLFFYGAAAVLLALPWIFTNARPPEAPAADGIAAPLVKPTSILHNTARVLRIRNILLLGVALLGFNGSVQGTLGYLALYLRDQGWPPASADGALAAFHTVSMLATIPIALLSDRLGTRKKILLAAITSVSLGGVLLTFVQGSLIWPAVLMMGMVRDGFMAVIITASIETDGIGPGLAGTAMGAIMVFSNLGGLLAPALGNSLAAVSPALPFLFWAGLAEIGFLSLLRMVEQPRVPVVPRPVS